MRRASGAGLFVAVVAGALAAPAAGDGDGFVPLFDGRSLEGWVPVATDGFSVRHGVLVNDGGTGWLRSARPYKDFELYAEYRAARKGADSGVFFRASAESHAKGPHWPVKGYQLQVIDGGSHLMIFGHGTPAKFDRDTERLKQVQKGPGEWQTLTLRVVGSHAEAVLNGATVTVSDAIRLPEGYLGLQGENGHFEWRALRIKELPGR